MSFDYVDPSTPPPVDWTGPVFPEPLLYSGAALWFILLIAAVLGLLFYRQRLYDERYARRRAPEVIYHAVRRAIDHALVKTGDETVGAGRTVQDALDLHLGPLLAFSHALGGPAGKLKRALAGKAEPHDRHHHRSEAHAEPTAQAAVVVSAESDQRVIITPAQIVEPAHGHRDHGRHDHHEGEMSARDQRVAVREALEHLSDYWRREVVVQDLGRIQDALLIKTSLGPRPRAAYRPVRRREAPSIVVAAPRPR